MTLSRHSDQYGSWSTQPISLGAGPSGDGLGRFRISTPRVLEVSQFQYNLGPLTWNDENVGGSLTYLPNLPGGRLRLTGPNQSYTRQSKRYIHYQPGTTQEAILSFIPLTIASGITLEVGYGDSNNGLFFQIVNGLPSLMFRTSVSGAPVDTAVNQSDWNLDILDGSNTLENPSGIHLGESTLQILVLDISWLGRIRIGFNLNGIITYAHEFVRTEIQVNGVATVTLPVRYKISSDDTVGIGVYDLIQVYSQVVSEGGPNIELGTPQVAANGINVVNVTTRRPVLSVRPKDLFNAKVNRGTINLESFKLYSQQESIYYEIVQGGTLTGAVWTDIDSTYSITEMDVAANSIAGGLTLFADMVPANTLGINSEPGAEGRDVMSKLALTLDINGNHPTTPFTDILSLVVTSFSTVTGVAGILSLREIF